MKRVLYIAILSQALLACAPHPYLQGVILREEFRYQESISAFSQVQENDRLHPSARRNIQDLEQLVEFQSQAERELTADNLSAARRLYEKIIQIHPENPEAAARLASIREQEAQKQEAQAEQALKQARAASEKHLQQALKHKESGNLHLACPEIDQALQIWPENPAGKELEAEILEAAENDAGEKIAQARELQEKGELEQAVGMLESILSCLPGEKPAVGLYLQLLRQLALEAYHQSDYARAFNYFQRELKFNPEDSTLKEYLEKTRKLLRELGKK